ncbi:MAG: hypothetical protein HYS83_01125 [Candidatus Blackburnbacteria bacterium]|nr:hypothetical protein [Candidatus Blackburnbacteria bacterium]
MKGLGISFGEGIIKSGKVYRRRSMPGHPRWVLFVIILSISILIAITRLVDLQIIRGAYFRGLAEGNRIRRIPIKAPRGEILDRNGKVLARNAPLYKLAKFSEGGVVIEATLISREEALRLQTSSDGASILIDIGREYPLGPAAAHVLGYVNEASREEVAGVSNDKCQMTNVKYGLGDLIGRMGIEAQYECLLRGVNGEELIEVDTRGRVIRKLGRREPVPGETIKLTIDAGLQEEAYKSLIEDRDREGNGAVYTGVVKGVVVAQDPITGEVRALVSAPSFDPQKINKEYQTLADDPNMPFFNRAIGGAYHPGSTFKIVTAAAGLEDGKIDGNYTFDDPGIIRIGEFSYSNWYFTQYGRKEGEIGLARAITRSTDTFFYKLGEMVGVDRLAWWGERFGLGKKTGIDLPGEVGGLVPSPEWKERVKGERWFLGNTYHISIGQGDITATPLQINSMTSVVASGGRLCWPYLLLDDGLQDAKRKTQNAGCEDLGFKAETLGLITEGMIGACSPGGTAFPLFGFKFNRSASWRIACKTGTAETNKEGLTHAWITSFAPAATESAQVAPEIVVTALVEGGGEGSRVAAPVVKEVLDYWFNKR